MIMHDEQFEGKKWHLSHLSLSADQHCERWWQTLLLPTLHLCCGHREHPTGVQRLPGHHPENAPAAVRTLVMGAFVGPPPFHILEELFLFFLLLLLNPSATPDRPSCQGLWSTTEVCQIFLVSSSFFYFYFFHLFPLISLSRKEGWGTKRDAYLKLFF